MTGKLFLYSLMIKQQTITQNSIVALGGSIIQKLLTLGYFVIVARSYGPMEQGRYSTALAFATLFSVLIDLGLSSALTREIARTPEKTSEYTGQMMLLRLSLGVCVYGIMIAAALISGFPSELVGLIFIAGIAAVIDVITTSCWGIIRGFQNLWHEAVGGVLAIVAMIAAGLAAILFHMPISALVGAVLFGSIVNLVYVWFVLLFRLNIRPAIVPKFSTIRYLLIIAAPFAGAALFSRISTFADTSIVAALAGEQYAGWYAAGNKLILALNILPASVAASIYPAMSASFQDRHLDRIGEITARAIIYLFLMSMPIAVGTALVAPQLVELFYGPSYGPTTAVLQLLMPALVFSFLSYPIGSLLAATNRQRVNTALFGIAAAVSVAANITLIPLADARGSAIAASVTACTLFFLGVLMTRAWLLPWAAMMARTLAKIVLACALMAGMLLFLKSEALVLSVPVAVCVYGVSIIVLRVLPTDEIGRVLKALIGKRKNV